MAQVRVFEDNFWGTVHLLHHMSSGNLTQAVSLVASTFLPAEQLSHWSGPIYIN